PDCRAYEMVSPPDKNGGDVFLDTSRTRTATDGNAAEFASYSSFADAAGNSYLTEYVSERGASGWTTHAITPQVQPLTVVESAPIRNFASYEGDLSPDLDKGVLFSGTPLTESPNGAAVGNLYLRTNLLSPGPGDYQLLTVSSTPQPRAELEEHRAPK